MPIPLHTEHEWLARLVGDWTWDMEAEGGPGEPPIRDSGRETVRSLHGVWVLCEADATGPEGTPETSLMTLGYDPERDRFQGTFISSMMSYMWIYDGTLDDAGVLTVNAEGPSYTDEGGMAKYRDTFTFRGSDERVQTSSYQRPDGTWHEFMTNTYRRVL